MATGRNYHGLLYHPDTNTAFVFGGTGQRSCEKYRFPSRKDEGAWTNLRDMQEVRSRFNPCLFAGVVYLIGGGHPSFEIFEPKFDQFKDLKVQKTGPSVWLKQLEIDPNVGMAVQHQEKLVLISHTKIYRCSPLRDQIESCSIHPEQPEWSNVTPIVSGNAVFAVSIGGSTHTMLKVGLLSGRAVMATPGV